MSGYSEAIDCPRCGSKESLERTVDNEELFGFCGECGYNYGTTHGVATLAEVNEERATLDLEPLKELRKPLQSWKDDTVELKEGNTVHLPTGAYEVISFDGDNWGHSGKYLLVFEDVYLTGLLMYELDYPEDGWNVLTTRDTNDGRCSQYVVVQVSTEELRGG